MRQIFKSKDAESSRPGRNRKWRKRRLFFYNLLYGFYHIFLAIRTIGDPPAPQNQRPISDIEKAILESCISAGQHMIRSDVKSAKDTFESTLDKYVLTSKTSWGNVYHVSLIRSLARQYIDSLQKLDQELPERYEYIYGEIMEFYEWDYYTENEIGDMTMDLIEEFYLVYSESDSRHFFARIYRKKRKGPRKLKKYLAQEELGYFRKRLHKLLESIA